jgi:hypothetical protein
LCPATSSSPAKKPNHLPRRRRRPDAVVHVRQLTLVHAIVELTVVRGVHACRQ